MATGTLRGLNIHGGTFAFVTKYPKLHMPAIKVADMDLVDPTNTKCLLDGEFVRLGEAVGANGSVVTGSRRAYQILAADMPVITGAGLVSGYLDSAHADRPIDVQTEFVPHHGRPGRSDLQFNGAIPCIVDEDFEFNTRLINNSATYVPGDKLFLWAIANVDLPDAVKALTSRVVIGLVPGSFVATDGTADASLNGAEIPYVGVCTSSKDANGWIRVRKVSGLWTVSGASD